MAKRYSTRGQVDVCRSWYGKTLRHLTNGKLYVIGEKHGMSDFWLMQVDPPGKAHFHAREIVRQFKPDSKE